MEHKNNSDKYAKSNKKISTENSGFQRIQRNGTLVPKKISTLDKMEAYYPVRDSRYILLMDVGHRESWLDNTRKRILASSIYGKIFQETRFPDDHFDLCSTRFAPDGNIFVSAYGAGVIQAWNLEDKDFISNIRKAPEHGFPIKCLRFIPKKGNNFFAASTCGRVNEVNHTLEAEDHNEINSIDVDINGENVMTGGKDAILRVYDVTTSKDNVILTGSWSVEDSLQLWDFTSGKLIDTVHLINRPATIDGEFLYCAQFYIGDTSGNTVIVGGSGIQNVEIINVAEGNVSSKFKVHKSVQAVDTSATHLVFGGMESTFKIVAFYVQ